MRIKPQQSSHWYTPGGLPEYGADLRRARKEGLFPSVTSISQVIAKPAIAAWSSNLLLDAAWEYQGWELTREEFDDKVIDEWKHAKAHAAELGSAYHDAIEMMLRADDWTISKLPVGVKRPVLESVREWIKDNSVVPEIIEGCGSFPLGFGGRADLAGTWGLSQRPFMLDFKSQGKPGDALKFYPEMALQLAANAAIFGKLDGDLISFVFSTVEPGEYKVKVWGDNQKWFDRFMNRFAVWKDERNFDPLEVKR